MTTVLNLIRAALTPIVSLLNLFYVNGYFLYGLLGVVKCEPSTAPPLPHLTQCDSDLDYTDLCNQACHNHGYCNDDTICTLDSWGEDMCLETCAYRRCPGTKGPLPKHQCRDTDTGINYLKTQHQKPDECSGFYDH